MKPALSVLAVALLVAAVLLLQPWPEAPAQPVPAGVAGVPAAFAAGTAPDAAQPALRTAVQAIVAAAPRTRQVVRGRLLQDRRPLADATVYAMGFGTKTKELARATSEPDGTFALVVGRDSCWLAVQGATVPRGFGVGHVAASPIDRQLGDVHVPRGAVVEGIVRGYTQEPVPGALVAVVHSEARPAGPTADADGAPVVTDAAGRFRIDRVLPGGNRVNACADGDFGFVDVPLAAGETAEVVVALARGTALVGVPVRYGVTLRGTVRGHAGEPTTVYACKADDRTSLAEIGSKDMLSSGSAAVVDGRFELPDRERGEYVVVARAEGVGASKPGKVTLRDDTTVDLVVEPVPRLAMDVRDELGAPVNDAEVFLRRTGYVDGDAKLGEQLVGDPYSRSLAAPVHGPRASISIEPGRPLAFAVRAPGFVTMARAFAASEVPAQLDVVLQRAGTVRGVVRGGDRGAYASTVLLWRVEDDERMRTNRRPTPWQEGFAPHACAVDAAGSFGIDDLAPGRYRAVLSRYGLSRTDHRPDEQVGAIALVDDDVDWRGVVELDVHGGADTHVEIVEPKLGTLRGRVLLAGQPFAGALVVATRHGWLPRTALGGAPDWDDELHLSQAGGQRSAADGTFTFFYRDVGDVEVRVRHPKGDATSNPTIVTLPLPGVDVECTISLPMASVRGRFPLETLSQLDRRFTTAVLFPMQKAAEDPYASWDWHPPLTYDCARVELRNDGRFAFESLPAGDFVLRVYAFEFNGGRTLWQRVITVRDASIELGDLVPPRLVDAQFVWKFETAPSTEWGPVQSGVQLLRAHGDDPAAIWLTAFTDAAGKAMFAVEPGRYTLRPVDAWCRQGSDRVVEVAADGTVTPGVVTFPPPRKTR